MTLLLAKVVKTLGGRFAFAPARLRSPIGPLLASAMLAGALALGPGSNARAQSAPAGPGPASVPSIDGKLMQPAGGGPLEGITVTILETGARAAVDGHGHFAFPSVAPGTYTLEAAGNGYARLKITNVVVTAGQTQSLAEEMPRTAAGGEESVSAAAAGGEEGIQKLADFYVNSAPVTPFAGGANLDIPRTSDDPQPYTIINQEAIEQSDRANLGDFLQDELTQDTTGSQYNQGIAVYTPLNASAASEINLRGLGTLQTLILVNGARLPDEASKAVVGQANLNQIPLSAIDHIEILSSSASAIYGSSALGGVINVVLKNNFSGGEVDATYQNTFDTGSPTRTLSADYGFSIGSKTHVVLVAGYQDEKSPVWQDRPFDIDYYLKVLDRDPSLLYSASAPYAAGATPNIALDTAVVDGYTNPSSSSLILKNGTSLNSLITYIPAGTSPSTSAATLDSGLLADAGSQNFGLAPSVYRGLYTPMLTVPETYSLSVSIDHEFTPALEAFANFGAYHSQSVDNYISLINGQLTTTALTVAVPGNAPDNPFEQNVTISVPLPYNQATRLANFWTTRTAQFGLLGHLPGGWESVAEYDWGGNYLRNIYGLDDFASTTLYGADASALYNGTYNPFVDTVAYPQNMAGYAGTYEQVENSTLADFNLRASGPVYHLPGGKPKLTVGVEARDASTGPFQAYGTFPPIPGNPSPNPSDGIPNTILGEEELTQAAYAEAELPLVSEKNGLPLLDSLELQVAGRSEKFSVISDPGSIVYYPYQPSLSTDAQKQRSWSKFDSTNPTYALKWQPCRTLTFRASYAAAFVPPTYTQMGGTVSTISTTTTAATYDPATGATYAVPENSGVLANPNLRPQTSRAWEAGAIWEPDYGRLKGLRLDLEFYKIFEYNLIYEPSYIQALNTPSLSYLIPRDPSTGLVTSFTEEYVNLSQEYTDGWDLSADYRTSTSLGTFSFHAAATVAEHLKEPFQIGGPLVEYVGYADSGGIIKTKANASASWLIGRHWTLGWNTIYYDSYKQEGAPGDPEYDGAAKETLITTDTLPQGGYTVPAQVYHNVFASYSFGGIRAFHHFLDGVTVSVGINDVFNTPPPFDANSAYTPFYYSPYGSILLRTYLVRVKKEF